MSEYGEGYRPVHYAAYNGHLDVLKYLIEVQRVDVNARTAAGCTPLFLAAQQGHTRAVKYLIQCNQGVAQLNLGARGYSPLVKTYHKHTALYCV